MEWKRVLGNFTRKIMSLNRRSKRSILVATDLMGAVIILWLSYVIMLSEWWPEFYLFNYWKLFLFVPLAAILVFTKMGLYRVVMRAIGPRFFGLAGLSVCLLTLALCIFIFLFDIRPRTVPVIFGIILWLFLCGSRLFAQSFFIWLTTRMGTRENVLIYGAGAAGLRLAQSLDQSKTMSVEGFIDDDKIFQGADDLAIDDYTFCWLGKA